jgi:hypothetical protein
MMSSPHVSEARAKPPSSVPRTRGRKPCRSRGVEGVADDDEKRKRALELRERVVDLCVDPVVPGAGDEVDDHLGVDLRLEDGAFLDQPGADLLGVGEVAVVDDAQVALTVADHHRLRVVETGAARRRVAEVPHR